MLDVFLFVCIMYLAYNLNEAKNELQELKKEKCDNA